MPWRPSWSNLAGAVERIIHNYKGFVYKCIQYHHYAGFAKNHTRFLSHFSPIGNVRGGGPTGAHGRELPLSDAGLDRFRANGAGRRLRSSDKAWPPKVEVQRTYRVDAANVGFRCVYVQGAGGRCLQYQGRIERGRQFGGLRK